MFLDMTQSKLSFSLHRELPRDYININIMRPRQKAVLSLPRGSVFARSCTYKRVQANFLEENISMLSVCFCLCHWILNCVFYCA